MVSSRYSDFSNVDFRTNLTKRGFFLPGRFFFLLEHSRRSLTIRKVLWHDNESPRGQGRPLGVVLALWDSVGDTSMPLRPAGSNRLPQARIMKNHENHEKSWKIMNFRKFSVSSKNILLEHSRRSLTIRKVLWHDNNITPRNLSCPRGDLLSRHSTLLMDRECLRVRQ